MTGYKTSRVLTVALSLIILAIAIAAVISFGRIFFFTSNMSTSDIEKSKDALLSTSADRAIVMKVRGKIVADEDFRSYQINISPTLRTMTTHKGYLGDTIDYISLNNNIPAYEQFVYALYNANILKIVELVGEEQNINGVCANGRLYEFTLIKDERPVKTLWTTTCSNVQGSLDLKPSQISDLFEKQIPNSDDYIKDLW